MKTLTIINAMQELAKSTRKPCMYISGWNQHLDELGTIEQKEILLAAPYLNLDDDSQAISDGYAILMFDSEEEMESCYQMTVGDDGPTIANSYNGPIRIYALTCSPLGELQNENT